MKKNLFVIALGMVLALGIAAQFGSSAEASLCVFRCSCEGIPLKCCVSANGQESCKLTDVIQCPQVITC